MPSDLLLEREDLIECTPEALHRVAKTIIALVKSAGEVPYRLKGPEKYYTDRAGEGDLQRPRIVHTGHVPKAASASTPNPTLQRSVSLTALSFTVKNDAGFL